jgi:hypothetical protein
MARGGDVKLPEVRQMFALTRTLASGGDVSEIAVHPSVVQRHQLGPLAGRAGLAQFRDDLVRAAVGWARIERELPGIVAAAAASGIRVAPIKGVAYAHSLYELPAERPMTDIDLLVAPADEVRARDVLGDLGFSCAHDPSLHHASTWVRDTLVVDLHRDIIGSGRSRIDLDAVWGRVIPGWPAHAWHLEPVDALVFHLVHMARNRLCGPLIQVVDAARLLERADATAALARARGWGIEASVRPALRYCRDVLDDASRPGGWLCPSLDDVLAVRQPSTLRKLVFDVATAGSVRQLAARAVAHYIAMRMPSNSS